MPTPTDTDAKLGWSVYSYMSPEILLGKCDGAKSILLRIEGYCSKGRDASMELTQRAKAGLRPCCAVATHVLIPPVYSVGRLDRKKRNSTSLWQRFGPFATRNYAAATYFNANGELPGSWDWLATKHLLTLPSPLNEEDSRRVGEGVAVGNTDDAVGSISGKQSLRLASSVPPKCPKPPPPVHPIVASPSPAKSQSAFQAPPSRGSSSWEGEWNAPRTQP